MDAGATLTEMEAAVSANRALMLSPAKLSGLLNYVAELHRAKAMLTLENQRRTPPRPPGEFPGNGGPTC